MLDVGDLREGVDNIPDLVELALLCERLPNLWLRDVGTNHAYLNAVLPSDEIIEIQDADSFGVRYANMLYAFTGRHVSIEYTDDTTLL